MGLHPKTPTVDPKDGRAAGPTGGAIKLPRALPGVVVLSAAGVPPSPATKAKGRRDEVLCGVSSPSTPKIAKGLDPPNPTQPSTHDAPHPPQPSIRQPSSRLRFFPPQKNQCCLSLIFPPDLFATVLPDSSFSLIPFLRWARIDLPERALPFPAAPLSLQHPLLRLPPSPSPHLREGGVPPAPNTLPPTSPRPWAEGSAPWHGDGARRGPPGAGEGLLGGLINRDIDD